MKINNSIRILSASVLVLFSTQSSAEIFKCETDKGEIYYHDKPCPVVDKETEMRAEKDVENGYVPPGHVEEKNEKTERQTPTQAGSIVEGKTKKVKKSKVETNNTVSQGSISIPVDKVDVGMTPDFVMSPEQKKAALALGDRDDPEVESAPVISQVEKRKYLNITPSLSK